MSYRLTVTLEKVMMILGDSSVSSQSEYFGIPLSFFYFNVTRIAFNSKKIKTMQVKHFLFLFNLGLSY